MQEARRDSVSVSYVWENPRLDHWITRVSRALVRFYYTAVEVSNPFPNAPKQFPMMLKQNLENESSQSMKQFT